MRRSLQGPRDNNTFRNFAQSAHGPAHTSSAKLENSITYEGILNEYTFEIGEEFDHLFNTSYSSAVAKNVANGELDHYLCLEMKSKLDGDGLQRHGGRPPMNFSFVLDTSGSMGGSFSSGDSKSKMEVSKECMINLLSKLQPQDKFGLILFDYSAKTLVPLTTVENLDKVDVKTKILAVHHSGGTSILAGMDAAVEMLKPVAEGKEANRIFFLTDMNPSDQCNLVDVANTLAAKKIFISLIGIGVDFNTDLAYKFAKVKGCNSFSVSSPAQFRKQMNDDFDYSSMLICYDVSLKMNSSEFEVEEIYGSPADPNKSIGEVLKVDSICPSPKGEDGNIKGGVVVLKLKRKHPEHKCGEDLSLNLSYVDWNDNKFEQDSVFHFPDDPSSEGYFQSSAARKAITLVRYVKTVKSVLANTTEKEANKERLTTLKQYLIDEIAATKDQTMEKEILMIDSLLTKLV